MIKKLIFILPVLFVCSCVAHAEESLIPQTIQWDGKTYECSPWSEEYEGVRYADFDGDKIKEAVASFKGVAGETKITQPFHLIYKLSNGQYKLVKTIVSTDERLGEVRIIDINEDGLYEIAIFSQGGMHYESLSIYMYIDGKYELIFENGSACGIDLFPMTKLADSCTIKVGRANWEKKGWSYADEPLYQVYVWTESGLRIVKS